MTEQIMQRIDALAAKLGVASTELWRILVRQARVQLYAELTWLIVNTIGIYILIRLGLSFAKKDKNEDNPRYMLLSVLCFAGCIALGICNIINLEDIPTLLANPEFRALELLREAIR